MRLCTLLLVIASQSHAWNGAGHQAIAATAWLNLSPQAQEWVLIVDGYDIHDASFAGGQADRAIEERAIWPDVNRGRMRWTAPWHYISLPVTATVSAVFNITFTGGVLSVFDVETVSRMSKRLNVVTALRKQVSILSSADQSEVKRNALAWVVHLVGDIHQPLHCADDNDRGGNQKFLRFRNRQFSLHELWDKNVSKDGDSSVHLKEEVAAEAAAIAKIAGQGLLNSTPEEWALDSNILAREIYAGWAGPEGKNLGMPYQLKYHPVAVYRQAIAALRLAYLLEILSKGQVPVWK